MVKSKVCSLCGASVKNMSQHWYRMHRDARSTVPASKRTSGFKAKSPEKPLRKLRN